ncbi:MAG: hypothetical protein QY328_06295 [Anaerolineales bacterium]|jgi:hypothetical protein|nr:hypothetical protein [Anaerolineales bacterium]WKZ41644.1 MAG: hypothetical protein QY328_06295 [Anaerolineales bacterium]
MKNLDGCQIPCVPKFSLGPATPTEKSWIGRIKRLLAVPWNRHVKKWLKSAYYTSVRWRGGSSAQAQAKEFAATTPLMQGDWVRVRSREEILATLDPFKELKGCAFLPDMYEYCGTRQRVLRSMRHFMDERDYKLKKARGVILLENVICNGTPTFGECDRCCFLFWREEWLEKIDK